MINEEYAKKYCRDDLSKIENYEQAIADTTQTWQCHHRLELTLDGQFALTPKQLKMHEMYYNRPYYELIFLTQSEHRRLHTESQNHPLFGKHHSDETRRKMSESKKGHTINEETRIKMSESHKGKKIRPHTAEHRAKLADSARKRWARELSNK